MEAKVIVLTKQEFDQIDNLLGLTKNEGIIIVTEEIAKKYGIESGTVIDYDFAEMPDICIDIVNHENRYFLAWKEYQDKKEKEEKSTSCSP